LLRIFQIAIILVIMGGVTGILGDAQLHMVHPPFRNMDTSVGGMSISTYDNLKGKNATEVQNAGMPNENEIGNLASGEQQWGFTNLFGPLYPMLHGVFLFGDYIKAFIKIPDGNGGNKIDGIADLLTVCIDFMYVLTLITLWRRVNTE
jgi:hypothetical protein